MSEIGDIKKTLAKHEKRISDLEKRVSKLEKPSRKQEKLQSEEKVIEGLLNDGFFDNQKIYKEITEQLQINAVFDKKGNYKKALQALVRNKKLKRKQAAHQWGYSK